ncbi:MAG: nitrate- and nitrite sensing domain-containing protein [Alphaproteobacteria bacterium]
MLALPLLALLGVGGWTAWSSWRTAADMHRLYTLAELAPSISGLVHELQKERGNAAGFIGHGGEGSFADRLADQRRQTDRALTALDQSLSAFDASPYGQAFAVRLEEAQSTINELASVRREIDALQRSVADMAAYYTGGIDQLLGLIEQMALLSSHVEVTTAIDAYVALLQAKEKAGIERAMGANGFGAGGFSPNVYRRFVELIGQQDAYLSTFASQATADQFAFFQQTVRGSVVDDVARLRAIAIESPFTEDLQGVQGSAWFDAATKRIDLLKVVEDRLASDLLAHAAEIQTDARRAFSTMVGFLTALLIALTCLGLLVARHVSRPLSAMADVIQKLKPGAHVTIPGLDRQDEIGQLARAFEALADKSLEALRLKTALDSCQANMMVADRNHEIIYVNANMRRLLKSAEPDIRKDLPRFKADQIVGAGIEVFGTASTLQRTALDSVRTTASGDLVLGGWQFVLTVSPVTGEDGERLGTIVEWVDQTAERTIQREVDHVVAAAHGGDLSQRLTLEGKQGFMRSLAEGINQLTGVVEAVTDDLGRFLEGLAQGDLTPRITTGYQGKFDKLKADANQMADRLAEIVTDIQSAASEVANASKEISAGTEDLSRRTEQAASNLEETAAATEELAATVKQNAGNAKSANELAGSANDIATRGGQIADKAVAAMRGIEESAGKIDAIIGVIDEIAFQTNLLALNASVEAARAGEAGKGFAVVAQEVRQLAQRSAQAASDIKALIQGSNGQVKDGVRLVDQAGEALTEIVASIGQLATLVGDISTASAEQASGVHEINTSVTSMDEMTQQNSALVEQSSAAARALADQADKLDQLIGFFVLDTGSRVLPLQATTPTSTQIDPTLHVASADTAWEEF